jgi:hypothetical protein
LKSLANVGKPDANRSSLEVLDMDKLAVYGVLTPPPMGDRDAGRIEELAQAARRPGGLRRQVEAAMSLETTSQDCLRGAWAALLRGETGERDRLCARAEKLLEAERMASAVEKVLAVDFYVDRKGRSFPSREMAARAGVLQ